MRVVIADDQAMIRSGLRSLLEEHADIEVVAEASDGRRAIELVVRHEPDVALMDIRMPELDGISATAELARLGSATRVLVLTTFDLDEHVFAALRAGAAGFLLKDSTAEELVAAVRLVAGGDGMLSPAVTRRVVEEFASLPSTDQARAQQLTMLTPRELDVLRSIASGRSNAEAAAELFLGEATIKSHVSSVLVKLGLRDRLQAVIFAYETGFVRPGGDRGSKT